LPRQQLLQKRQIVFEISASRLSGCGGFQFLAQAGFHQVRGKHVTIRVIQNIGSRNTHGPNLAGHIQLQGRSSRGIDGWFCGGVPRRPVAFVSGSIRRTRSLNQVLQSVLKSAPIRGRDRCLQLMV
jgi:hypothetical protein